MKKKRSPLTGYGRYVVLKTIHGRGGMVVFFFFFFFSSMMILYICVLPNSSQEDNVLISIVEVVLTLRRTSC